MEEILHLVYEMSPYLLLGFLFAGLMHAFVPAILYHKYLGGNTFRSVFNAAALGVPLPLCSCGVIPTAMSLYRQGASKGACVSFLIGTPQTGVDSIIATYSLMGLPFALTRPIAALVTALLGGQLVNWFGGRDARQQPSLSFAEKDERPSGFWAKIKLALHYAFVESMQDIGRWLLLGLLIAGVITVFVPDSFFALFADNTLLSILLVLLCAIPMYVCCTGSIPIAIALILKGLSPGTALVLLMAGPAVNVASILVVQKVMGRRTLLLYLSAIIIGAVAFALGIDYLLPREWFTSHLEAIHSCHEHGTPLFNIGCSLLFFLLLANALVRRYLHKDGCHCGHHHGEGETCHCHTHSHEEEENILVLHITGMSCNHCRTNVERAIASVSGVESVTVDLPTAQARVTGSANTDEIRQAVEAIGFGIG